MVKSHDLILYYDKTIRKRFPLILIVGREPNSTIPFNNKLGHYNLAKKKGGWHWKRTHKYVGEIAGIKDFRKRCIKSKQSPLIYTDISPKPMKHHQKGKKKTRLEITEKEFKEHIDNIFSQKAVMKRVKLVILGIGNRKEFSKAVEYFRNNAKGKLIIETPFPINYNKPKVLKVLSRHREQIQNIVIGVL